MLKDFSLKNFSLKKFFFINLGLFIMSLGLVAFLEPSNLAVGGVMGLSMVIRSYFPSISLGVLMWIFNIGLIILAFFLIGDGFAGYTIYCSIILPIMIDGLDKFLQVGVLFPDDLMITLIMGILVQGIGMAIIFYQNASTGGTDILAKIISKYTSIDIGKSLFLADALITLAAAIAFAPRIGMYAFLGIILNSVVIDGVIAGIDTKTQSMIISEEYEKIVDFINKNMDRGATYIRSVGTYSKQEKFMINVVLSRREYIRLRKFVREVDPKAFITMHYTHEVLGEGFDLGSTPKPKK